MCVRCAEIERKLAQCRDISTLSLADSARDAINALIVALETEKSTVHSDVEKE
jgi:hypothetical protein